jgi:hypothetical protein
MRAAVEQREELAIDMEHDDVASLDVDHLVAAFWNLSGAGDYTTGVCTENLVRVDDVTESPLMSVVNGWGNKLLSPRGRPIRFASRPRVHRAGDEASDDG